MKSPLTVSMRLFALVLLPALALLYGCRGEVLTGPPTLRMGRDECAECGMIISEDRCSSALLIERGNPGDREHAMFDDIGCMLDYEHHLAQETRVVQGFVHDHESRAWVPASGAFFLYANRDRLRTPMGSGIAAFSQRAGADEARRQFDGEIMDYQKLGPARRAWMEARYGKPSNSP